MINAFSKVMLKATDLKLSKYLFTDLSAGRKLALRFVAGETLEEAVAVARELNERGMSVSLDHLGESVSDVGSARAARDDYLACLDEIAESGLDSNVSVKLTQLGVSLDRELAIDAMRQIAGRAAEVGTSVTIDMEDSPYTDATLDIYELVQREFGNLGVAVQAYLYRTAADISRVAPLGGHIRLCKGAYAEPDKIAMSRKEHVDVNFATLTQQLMDQHDAKPAIATHDDRLIDLTRTLVSDRQSPFEFQMLYGIREQLQDELVRQGHPLRIYVPYGSEWYPYLTRRLAERPANTLFFMRALFGK
jgi:proline dehydrogenase